MRIVHFSTSKCAGGPYRLISLLRKHSNFEVNLIDLKRWGRYPQDIIYEEEKEKAIEIASKADIIQFHNYYDQDSRFFTDINFKELKSKGVKFLCQYRSEPHTIYLNTKAPVAEVVSYDIPTIVIAQYHERLYPQSRVVPNAIPSEEELYMPGEKPIENDILFSPTRKAGAWENRWNTKGYIEVLRMLKKLQSKEKCTVKILHERPLTEVLAEKQKSRIIIDDMITGSYHASGLEGLCQAKTVLGYLDHRMCRVLQEMSGTSYIPFVNIRLEDAYLVLEYLVNNHEVTRKIGEEGRKWIDQYWSEKIIVDHYLDVYNKLADDPTLIKRQESLSINNDSDKYFSVTLPDLIYQSRAKKYTATLSFADRISNMKALFGKNFKKKQKQYRSRLKITAYERLPKPVVFLLKKIQRFFIKKDLNK